MTDKNRILAVLVFLAGTMALFFWPTLVELNRRWSDFSGNYSYGYLVPLMAAYMLWSRLPFAVEGLAKPVTPLDRFSNWVAAVLAIAVSLVWAMGYLTYTAVIAQLALPLIYLALMVILLGFSASRRLLLPVLFCFYAIPVWEILSDPLRTIAVVVTEQLLLLWRVPALVDGYSIHLISGVVAIEGGCSGLNFLMTGLVIGSFYAFTFLSGKVRWAALAFIVALSLIANWVRIFVLVLIGHYSEMQHPLMHDHATFGWLVYAGALAVYFIVMNIIERKFPHSQIENAVLQTRGGTAIWNGRFIAGCLVGFVCLSIAVVARMEQNQAADKQTGFTLKNQMWQAQTSNWLPGYNGYDEIQSWRYQGRTIAGLTLTAVNYYEQRQGKELIHDSNQLAEAGIRWLPNVQARQGTLLSHAVLEKRAGQKQLFTVFRVGQRYTVNPLKAKLYQVFASLQGDGRAALLVFSVDCRLQCSDAADDDVAALVEATIKEMQWMP